MFWGFTGHFDFRAFYAHKMISPFRSLLSWSFNTYFAPGLYGTAPFVCFMRNKMQNKSFVKAKGIESEDSSNCVVFYSWAWAKHYILQGKDLVRECECVVCVVYPFCLFVQCWPRVIYRLFGIFCHLVSLNGPLFPTSALLLFNACPQ